MKPSLFSRFAIIAATGLLIPLAAAAATVESRSETFDVAPGGELVVDLHRGSILVRGESGNAVRVDFTRTVSDSSKAREEDYLKATPVTIEQRGNRVIVRQTGREPGGWGKWCGGRKVEATCTVVVPPHFDIVADTSGGRIDIRDITGTVSADTSGGDIECVNINGDVRVDTSGGTITLADCHGELNADTSGGDIRVEASSGPLEADTSGGDIRVTQHTGEVDADTSGGWIQLRAIEGDVNAATSGGSIHAELINAPVAGCRLSTSGGSIELVVPADAAFTIDAATSGGRVATEFDVPGHDPKNRTSLRGDINGGGPRVRLRTSGGGIRIRPRH